MTEKERYATIGTWTELFCREGKTISENSVRNRLNECCVQAITGRSAVGRLMRNGFYAESDVRKACADLLQDIPQADEGGFFEEGGVIFCSMIALSRMFGISSSAIGSRILAAKLQPKRAKDAWGRVQDFYPLNEVERLCADLTEELPQADENGVIEIDGKVFATKNGLAGLLDISEGLVRARIKENKIQSIRGKTIHGPIFSFYSLSEVEQCCHDLLQDIPQADDEGFFEKDGQTYGTIVSLSRLLGISAHGIRGRIARASLVSVFGRDSMNHNRLLFYSLSAPSH